MSYCRFGEGDVYVYGTKRSDVEMFECCGCWLVPAEWVDEPGTLLGGYLRSTNGEPLSYTTESRAEMIAHLRKHQDAGHEVPGRAFEGLAEENEWGKP